MNFDKLWLGTRRKLSAFLLGTITLCAFASMLALARAPQEPVELRCRGAKDALVDAYVIDKLDADTLSLNFNVSSRAAGPDSKGLDPGTCSWIDLTFKEDEWRQVHFQVTAAQAESIPAHLKNPNNYWVFFVTSSDRGYFEATSHNAWQPGAKQPVPDKPAPAQAEPNTPPASFGGKWNMLAGLGGTPFNLILQQSGNNVTGTYSPQDGTIEGTVTGKTLRFQWTQAGGYKGTGVLEIDSDQKFLSGVFTTIEGPKKGDNRVSATRVEAASKPELQPNTPPASFARSLGHGGRWRIQVHDEVGTKRRQSHRHLRTGQRQTRGNAPVPMTSNNAAALVKLKVRACTVQGAPAYGFFRPPI